MLTCSCGAVLVSNGVDWVCPYSGDKNYHEKLPETIADKRVTTMCGQERLKGKKPGRLVK
jgi:hypothetical protein